MLFSLWNWLSVWIPPAGVCSLNNKLYVVGGSDPCGQKGLKNCDAFDPVTKTWSNCASLNIRTCDTLTHTLFNSHRLISALKVIITTSMNE